MTMNRLVHETSPYLRQHATNPVDWFSWGDEAIAKARAERKPLFVSVGYSTCYWCHVMERESFENEDIGAQLLADFVSVKVDREERPDVDDAMMAACQVYTAWTQGRASGGWPLTVFLEPDTLRPFFAGTYFPPTAAFGRTSFSDLLTQIATAWRERPEVIHAQAAKIFAAVEQSVDGASDETHIEMSLAELAKRTAQGLLTYEDATHGGFGGAPKFPQPAWLELFAEHSEEEPRCAAALQRALRAMTLGGLHDHVGGGFHRYCVDALWRVPHFEKMLYDSSQLVPLLAAAADPWCARAVKRSLMWMRREMLRSDQLFHAALDAEVEGREGANYLWTSAEIHAALAGTGATADSDASWATNIFGLDAGTNFTDPHHPQSAPSNVLFLAAIPHENDWARLDRVSDALLAMRATRKQPRVDDKAILGWNALAIRAFAQAGRLLKLPDECDQARRSFDALWTRCVECEAGETGEVARVWRVKRDGLVSHCAQLEDVALLAHAATAVHEATNELRFELMAWKLVDFAVRLHRDEDKRWCERPGRDDWGLRGRSVQDGAVAGGAGTIVLVLAHLATRGERAIEARTLLTHSLRVAAQACLAAPTEAGRTLVAAHRAVDLVWPECIESVRVLGSAGDRVVEISAASEWKLEAGESSLYEVVGSVEGRVLLRVTDDSVSIIRVSLTPCTHERCLVPFTLELSLASCVRVAR